MAGWEGEERFRPLPSPPSPLQPRPDSKLASPPHCARFVSISPHIPSLQGFHVCPLVPSSRGSWDVPTQAIFTRPCPHRAVFWLRVAAWGAEPLPGLGVDSRSCEPRGLPCPGSISPSHLLKGVTSVQRELPRQWAEGDLVGDKRHLFGEQPWYSGKPGSQKLDPVCCGSQRGRFVGTGVGPLGQQAPQLPSPNTVKTIIDFLLAYSLL